MDTNPERDGMLTVFILATDDPGPLEPTFRALVPGSVSGVVSDVVVVSPAPDALKAVCEPMGADRVHPDRVAEALENARGEWALLLEAGAQPLDGWDGAAASHMRPDARPARFEVASQVEPFWRRLFGRPSRPLMAGFLLPISALGNALRSTTLSRVPVGRAAVTLPALLRAADDPPRARR